MKTLTLDQVKSIKSAKTLPARLTQMQAIKFDAAKINQLLSESEKEGDQDLDLTSKAILMRSTNGSFQEAQELTKWSVNAKPAARKTVIRSFIQNKQSIFCVHNMGMLKRAEASTMMQDFFTEGGKLDDVAEWLVEAGNAIKARSLAPDAKDGFWDALAGAASSVVNAIGGAISTVVDAVAAAGKNLFEAIKSVANWAQNKINDFVEAILRSGKKLVDILTNAAKEGLAKLNKFVEAAYRAGQKVFDIVSWALANPEATLISILNKAEQLVGSFTTLLFDIARLTVVNIGKTVRALLKAGKVVLDFISRLGRIAATAAKEIVKALKAAGQTIRAIILATVNEVRNIVGLVIDALKAIGTAIVDIFKEIAGLAVDIIAKFIGAMKDIGIALATLLTEIAKLTAALATKIMKGLLQIFLVLRDVLEAIAQKTAAIANILLTALLGTLIHLTVVVQEILLNVRAAFRMGLIQGLIAIGKSALTLMKEAIKISASAATILFTILLEIFGGHRTLTQAEIFEARKVFGFSINLDAVKVSKSSMPADVITWLNGNRAFTTMYIININSKTTLTLATLIHELTHVWQAENSGGVYMLEALHSQFFGKGYNLSDADLKKANGDILKLEREQQAVLIEEYWKAKFNNQTIPLDMSLVEPLAKQVYKASTRFTAVVTGGVILNPIVVRR